MFRMLVHWVLSAVSLMLVSRIVPGFFVTGLQSAMIAAVVIGFLNADHVPPGDPDLWRVPAVHQRGHDLACFPHCGRLLRLWLDAGILGRGGAGRTQSHRSGILQRVAPARRRMAPFSSTLPWPYGCA
jgi:hypothetical protein